MPASLLPASTIKAARQLLRGSLVVCIGSILPGIVAADTPALVNLALPPGSDPLILAPAARTKPGSGRGAEKQPKRETSKYINRARETEREKKQREKNREKNRERQREIELQRDKDKGKSD